MLTNHSISGKFNLKTWLRRMTAIDDLDDCSHYIQPQVACG